jgi:ketosteroid isomerase-like protein
MSVVKEETRAQAEIRAVLDIWVAAVRKADVDRVLTCYAPEVRAFDAIGPLQFEGVETYAKHWRSCMSGVHGEITFEPKQINIEADGDIGFANFLVQMGCEDGDGETQEAWMRGTVCLRRTASAWRIVHEHYSNPIDPKTMKAVTELTP